MLSGDAVRLVFVLYIPRSWLSLLFFLLSTLPFTSNQLHKMQRDSGMNVLFFLFYLNTNPFSYQKLVTSIIIKVLLMIGLQIPLGRKRKVVHVLLPRISTYIHTQC